MALNSINTNPSQRLLMPLVKAAIGDDVFMSGDGFLTSASVSLGEGDRSSRCSFEIYDPDQKFAQKYMQASYDAGGLVGLPPPPGSSTSTGQSVGGGGTSAALGTLSPQMRAMLDTIAWAEGADYNVMFTGRTFNGFADHPRIVNSSGGLRSTAAGRYQFLETTWDSLGLPDFTPQNQDRGCVILIERRGVTAEVEAGDIPGALEQLSYEWASLPPYRYAGQGTKTTQQVVDYWNQRLAYYQGSGPQQTAAVASTQATTTEVTPPVETADKGSQITIWMGYEAGQMVEFSFIHTGTRFKGMDLSVTSFEGQSVRWTLSRRTKNATYQNLTLKQLAQKVAEGYGLTLQMEVDGPTYEHLDQAGITDYQLLKRECDRIGFRIYDSGPNLVIEERKNQPLGFVLEYGINMDSFEVVDSAQRDQAAGSTASQSSTTTTKSELKTLIDPLTGQIDQQQPESLGAAGSGAQGAVATTGASTPPVTPKTSADRGQQLFDQFAGAGVEQREAVARVKGFPGSATFTATPASLTLSPDTPFITAGMKADFLNRVWAIETATHDYQQGSLKTTIRFYSPMAAKPGTAIAVPGVAYTGVLGDFEFINPMNPGSYTVTSRYGPRGRRFHYGIDQAAPVGTPIFASASGVLQVPAFDSGGYGNWVRILHSNGAETRYGHLSKITASAGPVQQGQKIGECGSTGRSTGPHLHFEIRIGGGAIDPETKIDF